MYMTIRLSRLMKYLFAAVGFILLISAIGAVLEQEEPDTVAVLAQQTPQEVLIIDPGHGGEDGGAVGISGILEKEINLGISRKLENLLMFCGVNTKMTRNEDVSLNSDITSPIQKRKAADIKERVKAVAETPNAVLISVHQNSFPQNDCKGAQVFFSKNNVMIFNDSFKNFDMDITERDFIYCLLYKEEPIEFASSGLRLFMM